MYYFYRIPVHYACNGAFDKRERYLNQIIKAERDWSKYNTARLYKKSNPPITNLYIENNDDD